MTTPASEPKAHQIALGYIEQRILSGVYRVGATLPPERELAAELGVSRGAVREAIRVLQAYGILDSQPGRGRGTTISGGQSKALGKVFSLHLATAQQSRSDLIEARVAFERGSAAVASASATEQDLAEMRALVDEMDVCTDRHKFNRLDTEFHLSIARVARNPLLSDLTIAIREALHRPILDASARMQRWGKFRVTLARDHRAIFEAIAERDAKLAADRVDVHIRRACKELGTPY